MAPLTWLITGCSSGLGEAIVKGISQRGDNVVATGRSLESLHHLQKDNVKTLRLDITDPEESLQASIDEAIKAFGSIDVLVNNAGTANGGTIEDLSTSTLKSFYDANLFAPLAVTRLMIPYFRSRAGSSTTNTTIPPTIVFIGSRSSHTTIPFAGTYQSCKAALATFAGTLRQELKSFPIRVLEFDPSRFPTEMYRKAMGSITAPELEVYQNMVKSLSARFQNTKAPGQPDRFADVVADWVKGEGVAEGHNLDDLPWRLPLGGDAFDAVEANVKYWSKTLREWEKVIKGVDAQPSE